MSEPTAVEVLHDDAWYPGWVERQRRDDDGWKVFVRFTVAPGCTFLLWRPAHDVRRGG